MALDTIVFDIGRVLVDFSLTGFTDTLKEHGAPFETSSDFIATTLMLPYERGHATSDEFLDSIENLLKKPIARERLISEWQRMFVPDTRMIALLQTLHQRYKTYLLSNTNELHWEYLNSEYKLCDYVHGFATSFEAGVMKPDPRIYDRLEEKYDLQASRIIFLDDIATHVDAALMKGWTAFQHESYALTVSELIELGIEIETSGQ